MNKVERAVACFEEGFSCSQAVFSTYGPELGLDHDIALKVATGFGGGMGRMGHICGAVTGAFMVIGLRHGRIRAEDEETRDKAYGLVRKFVQEFESRNGSIICRELLGCDISTPEGLEFAREKGLPATVCPKFVKDAADIIEQILE